MLIEVAGVRLVQSVNVSQVAGLSTRYFAVVGEERVQLSVSS